MGILVDIKKKMGDFLLEANFAVGDETLALLGASGSGKSMTLKCIAGIETPDEGRIELDDVVLFDSNLKINLPPRERSIGYLFQNYALFPNMTVEENIGAGIRLSKREKRQLVKEKIETFYLEGLETKRPAQLSGGQQQRVALARMLAASPKMILLDEPFSALDSYLRWQLEQEMIEVIEQFHKPTLFVSHNRDEVYRISDKIGVMAHGKLEIITGKHELFNNPQTLSGAILTGCKNFSQIKKINDHKVNAIDWQIELVTQTMVPDNEITYVGIRAHDIQIFSNKNFGTAGDKLGENVMACRLLRVIENTFSVTVILENVEVERSYEKKRKSKNHSEISVELKKEEWEAVKGDIVFIKIRKEALLVLE